MGFVQLIKVSTDRFDELEAAHEAWLAATDGQRTVSREIIGEDRDHPGEYWMIVEFPSHEDAMRNNELPATAVIAERIGALATGDLQFVNLDVRRYD